MDELLKVGKVVLVEGLKAVTLAAGVVVVTKVVTEGLDGVKELSLDDLLKEGED